MTSRGLTGAEVALAQSMFGNAIDYSRVRINARKWIFFQPRNTVMSPDGNIWFHPRGNGYCSDFCARDLDARGLFLHEMTHVWQRQKGIYLPLARHPFCRYDYTLKPGQRFEEYGLEQQAEIVRYAFLLREGCIIAGAPVIDQYMSLIPFAFMEPPGSVSARRA